MECEAIEAQDDSFSCLRLFPRRIVDLPSFDVLCVDGVLEELEALLIRR